jgi:hypothetical protein
LGEMLSLPHPEGEVPELLKALGYRDLYRLFISWIYNPFRDLHVLNCVVSS